MNKKILLLIFLVTSIVTLAKSVPMTPIVPAFPSKVEGIEEENGKLVKKKRVLLEVGAVKAEATAQVIVPLEVISDVDIKALVVDDKELRVPFEVELSRKPENPDMYKLNFSSKEIDIDKDGKIDTVIYANENINSKVIRDNYVEIKGQNISKEGTHRKKVYITVEVNE